MDNTPQSQNQEHSQLYLTQNASSFSPREMNNPVASTLSLTETKRLPMYPSISLKLIDEAINQEILPEDMR